MSMAAMALVFGLLAEAHAKCWNNVPSTGILHTNSSRDTFGTWKGLPAQ